MALGPQTRRAEEERRVAVKGSEGWTWVKHFWGEGIHNSIHNGTHWNESGSCAIFGRLLSSGNRGFSTSLVSPSVKNSIDRIPRERGGWCLNSARNLSIV